MTLSLPRTSDVLGGRRKTYRVPVARFVGLWSAAILAVAGVAAIGLFAAIRPKLLSGADVQLAIWIWIALTLVASTSLAWVLSARLAEPANTLLALKRIEGDASPVNRNALRQSYAALDEMLLRMAHEKNGRINELVRARDSARVEGEDLAAFFAGMTHELRTPLNAIMGYAMLMAEDAGVAGRDSQARDLDRILQSSRQLLRLINDVLDLTRLDAGQVVVDRSIVDVSATVHALVEGMQEEASGLGVEIATHVAPDARVILGDAARLRHCLTTIISKLLETNRGETVRVDASLVKGGPPRIEFRLTDVTGQLAAAVASVIEAEQLHLKGTPTAPLGSAALAMTVVRRMAALMSGTLLTEPTDNGQVIVLALPVNAGNSQSDTCLAEAVPAAPAAPASDRGLKTVLVIDDDEATIDLVGRWLTGKGYRVIAATSGPAGLELARADTPDFIVLDIIMPGQSGYEVLAEVKSEPALRNIPVIIVSSDDNRRLGLDAGAAEVLVKPLSRRELTRVLDVLGRQMSGDLLIVDDDDDVREIVQRFASQAGMKVRMASSVKEGMALARLSTPGAIILDLCMPESDGFDMIDELSKAPSLSNVPVMVLSQMNISVAEHARIREAGHVFHPKSTTSPSELVEKIKIMVAR